MKRQRLLTVIAAGLLLGAAHAQTNGKSEPAWSDLKDAYKYDTKSPADFKAEPREDKEYVVEHLSFSNSKGETVHGTFTRPKEAGKYPCVLLLHGLTSNKESMIQMFGKPLAAKGIASLALDAERHGERRQANAPPSIEPMVFASMVQTTVKDYRLALDYLKSRADVDSSRIGLVGYSMGAMMGSILSGVDDRVKAAVLCVGGDPVKAMSANLPEAVRSMAASVSPSNFIAHVSPRPLLFINGKQDVIVNGDAAKTLHDAAKSPKEVIWVESGHMLPPDAIQQGITWLVEKLGRK